jgi:hypothetical protein
VSDPSNSKWRRLLQSLQDAAPSVSVRDTRKPPSPGRTDTKALEEIRAAAQVDPSGATWDAKARKLPEHDVDPTGATWLAPQRRLKAHERGRPSVDYGYRPEEDDEVPFSDHDDQRLAASPPKDLSGLVEPLVSGGGGEEDYSDLVAPLTPARPAPKSKYPGLAALSIKRSR